MLLFAAIISNMKLKKKHIDMNAKKVYKLDKQIQNCKVLIIIQKKLHLFLIFSKWQLIFLLILQLWMFFSTITQSYYTSKLVYTFCSYGYYNNTGNVKYF